jgi:hypothetical protein
LTGSKPWLVSHETSKKRLVETPTLALKISFFSSEWCLTIHANFGFRPFTILGMAKPTNNKHIEMLSSKLFIDIFHNGNNIKLSIVFFNTLADLGARFVVGEEHLTMALIKWKKN